MRRFIPLLFVLALLGGCGSSEPHQSAAGSVHPPGWGKPPPLSVQRFALRPSVATATMYDSITLSTVPPDPFALGGYTAGYWPTYLPMRSRWPSAHTVSIAIATRYHADCLDVEPGDANPSEVPGWVRADKAAGFAKPCVYSSYYEWIERIMPVLRRAGIALSSIWKWVAAYVYHPQLLAGFDAQQWTDVAHGRNLDASLVKLPFLTIAQPPYKPPPGPTPTPTPRPGPNAARVALLRRYARARGCYRRGPKPHACAVWAREVRALEG